MAFLPTYVWHNILKKIIKKYIFIHAIETTAQNEIHIYTKMDKKRSDNTENNRYTL